MASIDAAIPPMADASASRSWRFSLGGLFRTITVCGLAMFAAVQFGPIAAARDMGIALAIALALVAWTSRSAKLWLATGLVAAVGFVPTILAAGAPFSERSAVCLDCGMSRETRQVCGWTTRDEVAANNVSRWAAPLVPAGHMHRWVGCSHHQRTQWFGSAPIACGGPREGAHMAWQLVYLGDHAAGERALREYQDIIAGRSTKSLAVHCQEIVDAADIAVQQRR